MTQRNGADEEKVTTEVKQAQRDPKREIKEKDELIASLLEQIKVRDAKLRAAGLLEAISAPSEAEIRPTGALRPVIGTTAPVSEVDGKSYKVFDGENGDKITLSQTIQAPFTLSCRLSSIRSDEDDFAYTQTTPPMPFLIGRFALYRVDNDRLRMNMVENSKIVSLEFDDGHWSDVLLQVDTQTATLIANGTVVGEYRTPPDNAFTVLGLGCGFLERGWKGRFDHFWIKRGVVASAGDLAKAGENWSSDPDLLFYFDGTAVQRS